MSFDALLNRTATVQRTALTSVGGGQWQESPTTIATGVRYRRWPAGAREVEWGRALGIDVTHKAAFLIDADVKRGDRLTDAADGARYEVLRVDPDGSHHHLQAFLLEREIEVAT